jgi:hypothetical protein
MSRAGGPVIAVVGHVVVLIGVPTWTGGLAWFGRLPGDIRLGRGNVRVFIPVV